MSYCNVIKMKVLLIDISNLYLLTATSKLVKTLNNYELIKRIDCLTLLDNLYTRFFL